MSADEQKRKTILTIKYILFHKNYFDKLDAFATIEASYPPGRNYMKKERTPGTALTTVPAPGLPLSPLPDIPGWEKLSRKKQDALLEHTSNLQQYRQMRRLGEFGELLELTQVQQLLDGEQMQMDDYLRLLYPLSHDRTIQRKQQAFAELAATIPNPILKRIVGLGQDVLAKFDRIAGAAIGDIRNALREMPMLPVSTEQEAGKYLEELNGKLIEERKTRRKKGMLKADKGLAEKMATNALIHYSREAKMKTSAEKRQFATRVVGWYMEAEAVHGTLRCGRIPIPDGIIIRRGRPRKNPAKEAA